MPLLAAALAVVLLSGCTTLKETYAGREPAQVWNAAIAAANAPEYYPDWFLTENEVWVDEDAPRIEVYRTIRRDLVQPRAKPRRETRTMQFTINLLDTPQGPTLQFVSRHFDVPVKARDEAQKYFEEVWDLLGGRPARATDVLREDEETVDIDDL